MRVSDASDASDALGNFFSPKKKILFFLCVCLTNFFPENLFFLLMSSNLVKSYMNYINYINGVLTPFIFQ